MTNGGNADQLRQLLEGGKNRGYVLYDDLDALLPEDYESGPELDKLLAAIEDEGIHIVADPTSDSVDQFEPVDDAPGDGIYPDNPVRLYAREVGQLPRLTAEAEIRLAEEARLGTENAERAKKDLVEANLRQPIVIARRYADRGVHVLELIQAGNLGLLKAAGSFDSTRGYRFSAYAGWLARRFIIRSLP